jgi:NAD-reducing hydrogenase small subunit
MQAKQEKETKLKAGKPALPRLATVWFCGCSGCHMSWLDLDEFLIELAGKAEIVFSPVMDVKEYPENVDMCLMEGAIGNEDDLELVRKIRARTKVLVSFGDCAVTANVPGIRNQLGAGNAESVLQRAYVECAQANPGVPKEPGMVPALLRRVMPVHEVVQVDYFLPGCPPPAERIKTFLAEALEGKEPLLAGPDLKFG